MATNNITINKGATYKSTVTVTGVNLTGYSIRSHMKANHQAPLTLDIGLYSSITNAASGVISINIPASITAAIPTASSAGALGTYVYDLEIEDADGEVTRILEGTALVKGEVTS